MRFGLNARELEQIIIVFSSFPEVDKAILYGSRAKGNFKPTSDIDICLMGSKLTLVILTQIAWQLDDLLMPNTFDISILHHITNIVLIEHIERVGQVIYEKQLSK